MKSLSIAKLGDDDSGDELKLKKLMEHAQILQQREISKWDKLTSFLRKNIILTSRNCNGEASLKQSTLSSCNETQKSSTTSNHIWSVARQKTNSDRKRMVVNMQKVFWVGESMLIPEALNPFKTSIALAGLSLGSLKE